MSQPMQPHSNSILKQLAKARLSEAHLDADVLTALSEGTLLKRERMKAMEHLATCAHCREVLSVSSAVAPEVAATEHVSSRRVLSRVWIPRFAPAGLDLIPLPALLARHT